MFLGQFYRIETVTHFGQLCSAAVCFSDEFTQNMGINAFPSATFTKQ